MKKRSPAKKRTSAAARKSEQEELLKKLRVMLFGDGRPERSLLVRIDYLERQVRTITRLSWIAVIGVCSLAGRVLIGWLEHLLRLG